MNGSSPEAHATESGGITELNERIRALELRLERLEHAGPPAGARNEGAPPADAEAPAAGLDTEKTAANVFTRVAMLCFVLFGALILRVLTQHNILGAGFGTILGFTYAGHLIVLSFLPGRFGNLARENGLFQCSGALLAFFITLESVLRTHSMERPAAMWVISAFALLALAAGLIHRKPSLAGTGTLGGLLSLVALDVQPPTVALQMALMASLAVAGLAASWREPCRRLRTPVLLLMMALVPAGLFFFGKEPRVTASLLGASAALWLAVLFQHLLLINRLRRSAAWLPLLTLWLAGIQAQAGWPHPGATAGGIAVFALACAAFAARRAPDAAAGLAGLLATAALSGSVGWPMLDATGLACAVGGTSLWFAGRRVAADWSAASASLLLLTAAATGLALLLRPPVPLSGMIAVPLSALLAAGHYLRCSRVGGGPRQDLASRLAPVALAAGLALLLGFFREVLGRLLVQPSHLLLGQTLVLAATALALTFWGHAAHRRSPLFFGLACMVLTLAKVLLVDLVRLKSLNMLASLVFVGLASVAISVILRRRS